MPRKRIKVDNEKVFALASAGMGRMDICRNLGISHDTLMRNIKRSEDFADSLEKGEAQAVKYVNSKLMQNIEEGQFQAIQFFLRNKRPDEWNKDQKQQVDHMINLDSVLLEAKGRLIEGQARDVTPKEIIKADSSTYKGVNLQSIEQKAHKNTKEERHLSANNLSPSSSIADKLEGGE